MAYQINYYVDRAMRRLGVDADTIGDALDRYPAPTGNEVAYARHSDNPSLNAYGYDGGWHRRPPKEKIEADRREEKEAQERARREEYAARPHVRGVLSHDRNTLVIRVPGRREPAYITMSDLRAAARQDGPEAREVYGRLLAEAEELLRRRR